MRALRLIVLAALSGVLGVLASLGVVYLEATFAGRARPSPITVSRPMLDFGWVPLRGSQTREIMVRNDGDGPLHAKFLVRGASYSVDPEELILHPGVEWAIRVVATPERPGRIDDLLRIQIVGQRSAAVVIPLAAVAGSEEHVRGLEVNRVSTSRRRGAGA